MHDDDVIEGTTMVAAPAPPVEPVGAPLALTRGLVDTDAAKALAAVDRRIEFIKEVRARTLKLTLPQDWVNIGGKPWLQVIGAQRIKQPWGVYFKDLRIEPSLDETRRRLKAGEHVSCEVLGIAGCRITGEESVILGGRSTEDGFFTGKDDDGAPIAENLATMDAEDLRKAAVSNWEVRAVTDLLGLRGLTWEDLQRFGISKEQAGGSVTFRSGASGGDVKHTSLATEIREKLTAVHKDHALEALYLLSKFKGQDGGERGLKTWKDLDTASEKWLGSVVAKVRTEHASWLKTQPATAPPSPSPPPPAA